MTQIIKALTIVKPYGSNIASGRKKLEFRSWLPPTLPVYDLLIVENGLYLSVDFPVDPEGIAVAIVDVLEAHEWQVHEVEDACSSGWTPGYWACRLSNVRPLYDMVRVAAKLKMFDVDRSIIKI